MAGLDVTRRYALVYKPLVFVASLTPFALLVTGALGLFGRDLGPDPVEELLHTCGKTSLNMLWLTLFVTPVRELTGYTHLLRLRRMLGLFAFFYAALHFFIYLSLELGFDFAELGTDIAKRPYITVGFAALLILVPLAVTSTNRMMRKLGRRWQTLHRWIYAAAILGLWHYYWQVKADIREPLIYAAILAALLGYRLWRFTSKSEPATAPEKT